MNLRIHRLAVSEIDREIDDSESRQAGLWTIMLFTLRATAVFRRIMGILREIA